MIQNDIVWIIKIAIFLSLLAPGFNQISGFVHMYHPVIAITIGNIHVTITSNGNICRFEEKDHVSSLIQKSTCPIFPKNHLYLAFGIHLNDQMWNKVSGPRVIISVHAKSVWIFENPVT